MNHASWKSWPVPVFPASGRPIWAALPVPLEITPSSIAVTCAATEAGITCLHRGLCLKIVLPSLATTFCTEYAVQCLPPLASVEYAVVIESGETATAPSVIEQTSGMYPVRPIAFAACTTLSGPMSAISWAKMTLIDSAVACHRFRNPRSPAPSALKGFHGPPLSGHCGMVAGDLEEYTRPGGTPCSIAATTV